MGINYWCARDAVVIQISRGAIMTMDIALILFTAALGLAVVIAYFIAFRTTSEVSHNELVQLN